MDQSSQNYMAPPSRQPTRKDAINHFLSDLSPWDLLYLRGRLRDTPIILAGLHHLPPEIICLILTYLDANDLRACRVVSRAWSATWTQDVVLARACRQFFPGLIETYPVIVARQLFSFAIRKRVKWQRPRCKFKWIQWNRGLSRIFTEDPAPPPTDPQRCDLSYPTLYARDKLAWQPDLFCAVVDDLRTRERRRFVPPKAVLSGETFQIAAISDQLLVMLEMHPPHRKLLVADLATKEWKHLFLPGPFATAHVDHGTLSVVTKTGQITVFVWGGRTIQLDLNKVERCPANSTRLFGGVPKVLPHPVQQNVVYAVWACSHKPLDERLCSFVVVKFEDGHPVWNATDSIPNPLRHAQDGCIQDSYIALSFSCRRSDNHGSFALGIYRIQGWSRSKLRLCACCEPRERRGDWGAVNFNVLTQTFRHYEYQCLRPDLVWDGGTGGSSHLGDQLLFANVHLWNEDLLLAATLTDKDNNSDLHMQTIHPLGEHKLTSPLWAPIRLRSRALISRPEMEVFQDDDFVVVPTVGGVSILEPSETPSEGRPVDTVPLTPCAYGLVTTVQHWPSTLLIEIQHQSEREPAGPAATA
ncbi:hypothetical protein ACJ41O_014206 [Fusarium nematophilum]